MISISHEEGSLIDKQKFYDYLKLKFKNCPMITEELIDAFNDWSWYIVDPFDKTVNKANTVT